MKKAALFVSGIFVAFALSPIHLIAADAPVGKTGPQVDGHFRKVILDEDQTIDGKKVDTLKDPMELAVAPDGRVFYAQRNGIVKMWKPDTKATTVIAEIAVFDGLEDGMLGITLDPNFAKNGWVYLNHSLPETTKDANGKKTGIIRVSRYTLAGEKLDLASEKTLLETRTQREECCHVGGSLAFDANGNLYASVGDNTNPFASDGYSPTDELPGRSPWDAQKSAANPNDLRGKINRIHPEPDGTVTIPKGNLFPPGTPGTRPEIYVMGNRNPFRISTDKKNGFLYWGEVGPDAGGPNEKQGPAGFDEVNQARQAGFFGWPYFIADNKPYAKIDFAVREKYAQAKAAYDKTVKAAKDKGEELPADVKPPAPWLTGKPVFFDAAHPVNNSPNNTGKHELPPAQPAFIYYPHSPSTRFPIVNGPGGRTAMAGPVYYFDANNKSTTKLPPEYDHTLFIYEWSRNWIIAVHLDANDNIARNSDNSLKMERFCPKMTFTRPMDLELGADGCLYLIEWGTAWGNNLDTQIVRLEYSLGTQAAQN
ncbi:MAG: PQQ-dependent sugar dehydrogenase [Verrucomicrobia bacterium]|nr:PQQ-dependent sugar dehydrogenase [Verrucomicrobiota bacterium]